MLAFAFLLAVWYKLAVFLHCNSILTLIRVGTKATRRALKVNKTLAAQNQSTDSPIGVIWLYGSPLYNAVTSTKFSDRIGNWNFLLDILVSTNYTTVSSVRKPLLSGTFYL